jgi:hypothetical protein
VGGALLGNVAWNTSEIQQERDAQEREEKI